jgi:hypothetical protein
MVVKTNEKKIDNNDSNEERDFEAYLIELKKANIILDYKRAETFVLNSKELKIQWLEEKVLKTKSKPVPKSEVLIKTKSYTPDFEVKWNLDNQKTFKLVSVLHFFKKRNHFVCNDKGISFIEIKPIIDMHNMTRLFKTNQAFMWDKHNIYVNLITPENTFKETFTPIAVRIPFKKLDKKNKWERVNLIEFLNK